MKKTILLYYFVLVLILGSLCSCASVPQYVTDTEAVYPSKQYIAAQGIGATVQEAEADAVRHIAQFVGTSITVATTANTLMQQSGAATAVDRQLTSSVQSTAQTKLFALSFSKPYFDRKYEQWYTVAYIKKKDAAKYAAQQLELEKKQFIRAYEAAKQHEDPLLRFFALKKAEIHGKTVSQLILFASAAGMDGTEKYHSLYNTIQALPLEMAASVRNSPIYLTVTNDYNDAIASCLAEKCAAFGLILTDDHNSQYRLECSVSLNRNAASKVFLLYPSIETVLKSHGKPLYSYTKNIEKITAHTADVAQKKAFTGLQTALKTEFLENL